MTKTVLILLTLFSYCLSGVDAHLIDGPVKSNFLLSYPRSGQTWLLNCLQFLTHRPVMKMYDYPFKNPDSYFKSKQCRKTDDLIIEYLDFHKEPIYHGHRPSLFSSCISGNNLIVLQRDYREALIRNFKLNKEGVLNVGDYLEAEILNYIQILNMYDQWEESSRLLICYEDLIEQPRVTLLKVLRFLDESEDKLEEFLSSIDVYKARVLSAYQTTHQHVGGSITKGDDLSYHTMNSPVELVNFIDDKMMKLAGEALWEKYLMHHYESTSH